MTDLAANIDAVTELVREHAPAHLAAWWRDSLAEFNTSAGRKTLCTCLGVEPYSGQFPSFRAARAARDEHLRSSCAAMAHPSIRSFQTRIESFQARTWPGVQMFSRPPERLTTVERELFYALKIGRVPGSVGGLQKILFTISGK